MMRKFREGSNSLRRRATAGRWFAGGSALAIALGLPGLALAQAAESQPAASPAVDDQAATSGQFTDIVVTARRTEERLQDIPASVSAITGDQLDGMGSLADIQSMVSGVTFQTFGPTPAIGIRGFGNRTQVGNPSNSAVGIFQDGVFVAPALATISNRVDVERVEVAKGPQSTLYGRSSFIGAINTVSNDPTHDFSGYLDVGLGGSSVDGDDLWHVRGAVSVPVNDTLSMRFFGLREFRDGFTYDSVTGNRGAGYDRKIGRVRILWEPSDVVEARLTGTVIRDNIPFGLVRAGRITSPFGRALVFSSPLSPAARAAATEFGDTVWDAQYAVPQSARIRGEQITLDLRFDTPMGELASLTDYQNARLNQTLSLDLSRLGYAVGNASNHERRWSQELRLSNNAGRLSYLGGIYFLRSVTNQSGGRTPDFTLGANFGPGSVQYDLGGVAAAVSPIKTETNAYAAFGQIGYDIIDRLNLTVGLRYGVEEISGYTGSFLRTTSNIVLNPTPITQRRATFDALTGGANLSYEIAPDVLAYAAYSRGDSPGGFNGGGAAHIGFSPQKVDAFEVGFKSQLLDRRLQLNVALFENKYSDLHLSQNVFLNSQTVALVTNAGKARGRGLDLDAQAILSDNWRIGVQYTYSDSKITEYSVPPPPAPQVDITGVPLVRSPKHSLNASISFNHDIGPGEFQFTAEESYTSSYANDYLGEPAGYAYPGIPGSVPAGVTKTQVLGLYPVPGYALTNLNASYTLDSWEISAYVRNLFNKQYIASVIAFDLITAPLETAGPPRTFEVSLKYKF